MFLNDVLLSYMDLFIMLGGRITPEMDGAKNVKWSSFALVIKQ